MRLRFQNPSHRVSFLAISALAFGFACLPGNRPPDVAPRGTLAPGAGDGSATPDSGAFAVVFASPRGDTQDVSEISIVWNRPMRALELAGAESPAPVKLTPAVAGRWNWVGTSAVTFVPEKRLPRATAFTVEVPAGTKALDGSVLEKPYTFKFSTPRPLITSMDPMDGADNLRPEAKFTVRTNQPVEIRELEKALTVKVGPRQSKIGVNIVKPQADNEQLFEVTPRSALPLDSDVVLEVAGLYGKEGNLQSEKSQQYAYRTYGPLALKEISCDYSTPHGQCASDGGVSISFSTRVKLGDLKRAVKFDPNVKVSFPSWLDEEDSTRELTVYGAFPAGKKIKLSIAGSLKDENGQTLGADVRRDVIFDDLWPKADIGLRGDLFESAARREIPIDAINANDLELVVAPLTPADAIRLQDDQYSPGHNPRFDLIAALPSAKITKLPPNAAKNATSRFAVNVNDVLGGKDTRGAIAMGIRYTGWPGSDHARGIGSTAIAKVTDLAISGKISRRGSLLWISRLSSAEPLAGAEITIERPGNAPIGPFKSDASGFVTIPTQVFAPNFGETERAVVVVRHGNDWTYKHLDNTLDGWRFDARVDTSEERPFGLVFTDRGIYRPGDTVHVKGIFRKEANPGTATPVGSPVEFKVENSQGEEIAIEKGTLSPFGTASFDVVVPRTGKLGTYSIRANVGDGQTSYAGDAMVDFEVAEYRPVEFAVSVESDKPSYIRGDSAKWTARGDYLYGAPMATADARLTVTRDTAYFRPPNTDEFVVDDEVFHSDDRDSSMRGSEVGRSEVKLDAKGTGSIAAKLTLEGQTGTERITAEADVTDVSRQSVAGSTTAIVHPAEFYVALRSGSDLFVDAGKALEPEVFAVDPKGNRVGGVTVKIELVHRTWEVARKATPGGATHTEVEKVDKVVESCSVTTTASKPGSCKITPAASGYHIIHATAVDARKNPIGSSEPLYVFGGAGSAGFGDSDRLAVELVPDKESYEIGQTAKILVKSPFTSADALVTIERAGILSQRKVQLKGPMPTIEVPITEDYRPNAFVSVMLVRGRTKPAPTKPKEPDVGAPAFRMGYASLLINPEKRRLKIALSPNKTEAKPGENIDVDIKVTDHAGKPARSEVTFYAVDEGVLSLIGYKTPDPIGVFGAARPLRVASLEMRESLAKVFRPYGDLGVDKGLDGGDGGGGMSVRRDFRSSATFAPNVITDDSGRAHVTFRLPDTLTTYRLMAVTAAEDDRFGFAENRVVASRPLMARPAMPRFFRAGDSVDAGIILSSKGTGPMKATVQVKPQGLALREADTRTVDLAPGTPIEVRFPLSATHAGTAKIGFVVKASEGSKTYEDAVEISRDIRVPLSPEAVALYGDTTSASAEKLGDLKAIRDDVGGLEVSLSSTALVGLGGGVEQLVEYPYGCTEQLVSKLVPLLPLRDLAKDFSIPLPKNTDAIIQSTVAQVLKHQRGDGGFGMWMDSQESNLWATTYALWGLGEAKRRGVEVPESTLEDAARIAKRWLEKPNDEYARAASPFILDVLAENGHPEPGRVTKLFEERKNLPLFSQAFLLHAMVVGKGDSKSIDTLVNELEGSLRLDANIARVATNLGDRYAVLMDSDTRTTALVLRALLAAKPNHPLASKLAMGLLADRKGGTWRNTQETAWSLMALSAYKDAQEKAAPNFLAHVFLGQAEIAKHPFKGASVDQFRTSVPADRLVSAGGSVLAFDVDGSGRLFYEARLRYAPKQLPTTGLERGFFVQKTLRPVTPETLAAVLSGPAAPSVASFVGGNLVLAEVVVVTPSPRRYVVVDDPLPAGFEPVDARLATTAGGMDIDDDSGDYGEPEDAFDDPNGYDDVAAGRKFLPSSYVRELRDDRALFFIDRLPAGMYRYRYLVRATTLGSFILPPTRAEEMYTPEVFGRTAAGTIQVTSTK